MLSPWWDTGRIVAHIVTRVLDQFGIESPTATRWNGVPAKKAMNLAAVNV